MQSALVYSDSDYRGHSAFTVRDEYGKTIYSSQGADAHAEDSSSYEEYLDMLFFAGIGSVMVVMFGGLMFKEFLGSWVYGIVIGVVAVMFFAIFARKNHPGITIPKINYITRKLTLQETLDVKNIVERMNTHIQENPDTDLDKMENIMKNTIRRCDNKEIEDLLTILNPYRSQTPKTFLNPA